MSRPPLTPIVALALIGALAPAWAANGVPWKDSKVPKQIWYWFEHDGAMSAEKWKAQDAKTQESEVQRIGELYSDVAADQKVFDGNYAKVIEAYQAARKSETSGAADVDERKKTFGGAVAATVGPNSFAWVEHGAGEGLRSLWIAGTPGDSMAANEAQFSSALAGSDGYRIATKAQPFDPEAHGEAVRKVRMIWTMQGALAAPRPEVKEKPKEPEKKVVAKIEKTSKDADAKRQALEARLAKNDPNAAAEMLQSTFDKEGFKGVTVTPPTRGQGEAIFGIEVSTTDYEKLSKDQKAKLDKMGVKPPDPGGDKHKGLYRLVDGKMQKQVDAMEQAIQAGSADDVTLKLASTKASVDDAGAKKWLEQTVGHASVSKAVEDGHSIEELEDKLTVAKTSAAMSYTAAAAEATSKCEEERKKFREENYSKIKDLSNIPPDMIKKEQEMMAACEKKAASSLADKHARLKAIGAEQAEIDDKKRQNVEQRLQGFLDLLSAREAHYDKLEKDLVAQHGSLKAYWISEASGAILNTKAQQETFDRHKKILVDYIGTMKSLITSDNALLGTSLAEFKKGASALGKEVAETNQLHKVADKRLKELDRNFRKALDGEKP